MAHFAEIDENNVVQRVIVAEKEFIDSGVVGDPAMWIQTSYNTIAGEYTKGDTPEEKLDNAEAGTQEDRTARARKNFAGIGYTYDPVNDAFISPKPYPSWLPDKATGGWTAPVPYPEGTGDVRYEWDEDSQSWVVITR